MFSRDSFGIVGEKKLGILSEKIESEGVGASLVCTMLRGLVLVWVNIGYISSWMRALEFERLDREEFRFLLTESSKF